MQNYEMLKRPSEVNQRVGRPLSAATPVWRRSEPLKICQSIENTLVGNMTFIEEFIHHLVSGKK